MTWLRVPMGALLAALWIQNASAERAFTWQEIRDKFETQNPTLRAGEIGVSESRTQESAKKATGIAVSSQADLERNLLFSLRHAFVQTLQAKPVLALALDRLELQRVQFESDVQTAEVNLRTAKIQMLMLLNERTAVETFDVAGPFDFTGQILPLDEFRLTAASHLNLAAGREVIQ